MLQSAFSIVAVVFLMIAVGYVFQMRGWLGANASTVLTRLTLRVGLPGLIFSNIFSNYDRQMLLAGGYSLLVPLFIIGGMYLFSGPLAKWIRVPKQRLGVFRALFTFGNAIFIGMPVCRAIFGEGAVPDVLLYYLVNTLLWWLIGAPNVAKDGGVDMRNPIKRLASPPLITCLVSIVLVLIGIKPPEILMTTASYLGAMVTPLSMLFIGATLCTMMSGGLKWQKGYGAILLGRFVLGPLLCLPLCLAMGIGGDALGVFFLQSGMPCQTQSCLWAQEQGADAEYAAGGISLTTLASVVTIPIYAFILSLL